MVNRTSRRAVFAALFAVALATTVAAAQGSSDHRTTLTFSKAVRLPGVELNAGSYIFEVASPGSGVVRVMSADRRIAYFQAFTNAVERPAGLERHDTTVRLREAAAGEAPAIDAWWAEGESRGHAFIY
jgi:hypothetical protein